MLPILLCLVVGPAGQLTLASEDLPVVEIRDLDLFPCATVTSERVAWLDAHMRHIDGQLGLRPYRTDLRHYRSQVACLREMWAELLDAHKVSESWVSDQGGTRLVWSNVEDRLAHLESLRRLLGPHAYHRGEIPWLHPP